MPADHVDPADAPRLCAAPGPPDASPPPPNQADREAASHTHRTQVDRVNATTAWAEAFEHLRLAWAEHKQSYPERNRLSAQTHPDNSWSCGERKLAPDQNAAVDLGYARAREIGETGIVPGLLAVETQDSSRRLAGFDHRIKGEDRLKEKVADRMRTKGRSPDQALAEIPDTVRFTFEYSETTYSVGVQNDVKRLEDEGFEKVELRNSWSSDQYKGINTRWREPRSSLLFEVQFHTQASLEAKELTHEAYERIRSTVHDDERVRLKEFQRRVNSMIPVPPGVAAIEDYPLGET